MLLRALEDLSNVTQFLEQKFADELHIFFQYLGRKIIENVDLEDPLSAVFYQQANGVIQEHWKEYDDILATYFNAAGLVGYVYHKILLKASQDRAKELSLKSKDLPFDVSLEWYMREQLTHYNPEVAQDLEQYKFVASEKTMNRVTTEINNILSDGYRTEKGHYEIRDRIKERFTQLSTYESMRIAQTEVNSMRNYSQFSSMLDDEMEYKIWMEANDSRTRSTHRNQKGGVGHEIVPINEKFSNGLMYAGEKVEGKIKEWVNCRCSIAAYIIPMGYQAPPFFPFREKDLVKVGDTDPASYLPDTSIDVGIFDQEKFDKLRTSEEVAEFFGLEYNPNGKYFEAIDGHTIEFYDPKNDVVIRFFTDDKNRNPQIDFTNEGKTKDGTESLDGYDLIDGYDLKDCIKAYVDTPDLLKNSFSQLEFLYEANAQCAAYSLGDKICMLQRGTSDGINSKGQIINPLEYNLRHEMSHSFEDTFINPSTDGLRMISDITNRELRDRWIKAKAKDYEYQKENGFFKQDSTDYGSENNCEDFAEMGAIVSLLEEGKNYNTDRYDCEYDSEGYPIYPRDPITGKRIRNRQDYKRVKERCPYRYALMKELLKL